MKALSCWLAGKRRILAVMALFAFCMLFTGNGVSFATGDDITTLFGVVDVTEVDGLLVTLFSAFILIAVASLGYAYVISGIKRGKRAVV